VGTASPGWRRTLLGLLFVVFGGFAAVSVAGGPDPLGDVSSGLLGGLLLAWIVPGLRGEASPWERRLQWVVIVVACVLIVGTLGDLLL